MGVIYLVQYVKDISTEKWMTDGLGKQVFFNLLTQVFTMHPEMPINVKTFTFQQFDKQDSLLHFMNTFVQAIQFENLSMSKKKACTVSIKGICKLYTQYVAFERLPNAKLRKHIKNILVRKGFSIVKTKKALVVRGILLNVAKVKLIFSTSLVF